MKKWSTILGSFTIGIALAIPLATLALVSYPPGSLLQPGDVTGTTIRALTITDANISNTAAISATKIAGGGVGGNILFSASSQLGTSTGLTFSTSTNTLTVVGGTIAATSTSFGGWKQTWPSAHCSANQVLEDDGTGTLTCASLTASSMSSRFTAGETIAAGNAVGLGTNSATTTISSGSPSSSIYTTNCTNMDTGTICAVSTTTPATILSIGGGGAVFGAATGATTQKTYEVALYSDNNGEPGTELASSTQSLTGANATCNNSLHGYWTPYMVNPNTKYWLVFKWLAGGSGTNIQMCTASSGGDTLVVSSDNGSTWGATSTNAYIVWDYTTTATQYLYNSSSASANYRANSFLGFAETAATQGDTISVDIDGITTAATCSSLGSTYYLNDTQGSIGTSSGTVSRPVGLCVGTNALLIKQDNP